MDEASTTRTTGAVRAGAAAVVQAHDALDDRDVGTLGAVQEQRNDELFTDEHRVEVATRPSGGQRVVAGIDVVGADLVRAHAQPADLQRSHQPGRDRRLARTGGRRGDHQARDAHHSIPR